jgi:hypothetical protein
MQVKPRSYPHPVLASDFGTDIVDSIFQPVVEVKGSANAYEFKTTFKTNNEDLQALVQQKKAQYAVHVECIQTRYRKLFTATTEAWNFQIPSNELDGRVEICCFILAAKPIDKYKNSAFHPDYGKLSFMVRRGDTLAVGSEHDFTAEKKEDPLGKVPSIFAIVPNDDPDAKGIDVNLSGPKVRITLSKDNFEKYKYLRANQSLHPILAASVIVPALVNAIDEIRRAAIAGEMDDLSTQRWYLVVARRLRELGVEPEDAASFNDSSLKLAQDVLGQPVSASLDALKLLFNEDSE